MPSVHAAIFGPIRPGVKSIRQGLQQSQRLGPFHPWQFRPHGHISNQVWRASTCWHCSHLPSASNSIIGNITSKRNFGIVTGVSGFRPYARQVEHCTIHFWHRLSRKNQSSVLVSVFIDLRMRPTTKDPPPTRGVNRDSGTASANGG